MSVGASDAVGKSLTAIAAARSAASLSAAKGSERPVYREQSDAFCAAARSGPSTCRSRWRRGRRRLDNSYVVTVDDITDLMQAQRSSAWADIARRIAHEIKNPLTPIQLSAERIRRRYGKVITEDREIFDQCIDTIMRQVGDIGRMVDEFSAFARMPAPAFKRLDLRDTLREAAFLVEVSPARHRV